MRGYLLDLKTISDSKELSGITDQILRNLDEDTMVLVMFSQRNKGISIGYDDTKAPYFKEGVKHYRDHGYVVNFRGAGGRSVASDEGVLNFSILMKTDMQSHDTYMFFYHFIQNALRPLNLRFDIGEVLGAYCPGTYDISIHGKKVAGTASRKINGNALIGCYLGVNGDQQTRSETIAKFYEITEDIIRVNPDKLTTLSLEAGREVSVEEVRTLLLNHFKTLTEFVGNFDLNQIDQVALQESKKRAALFVKQHLQD